MIMSFVYGSHEWYDEKVEIGAGKMIKCMR